MTGPESNDFESNDFESNDFDKLKAVGQTEIMSRYKHLVKIRDLYWNLKSERVGRPVDLLRPELISALDNNRCVDCGESTVQLVSEDFWTPVGSILLDDVTSVREYTQSGLCQKCQNELYGMI